MPGRPEQQRPEEGSDDEGHHDRLLEHRLDAIDDLRHRTDALAL